MRSFVILTCNSSENLCPRVRHWVPLHELDAFLSQCLSLSEDLAREVRDWEGKSGKWAYGL